MTRDQSDSHGRGEETDEGAPNGMTTSQEGQADGQGEPRTDKEA
ncbi:MAG: hypothetical protein PVF56_14800 [Desulfobacterales bacterium]